MRYLTGTTTATGFPAIWGGVSLKGVETHVLGVISDGKLMTPIWENRGRELYTPQPGDNLLKVIGVGKMSHETVVYEQYTIEGYTNNRPPEFFLSAEKPDIDLLSTLPKEFWEKANKYNNFRIRV